MEIVIQSLGFTASNALESFTREKLQTLKNDWVISATVTLYKHTAESNPECNYCEIKLEMPGKDPFVKKHSAHFETAISECVDVLFSDLQKLKEKTVDRRKGNRDEIQDAIMQADADTDEDVELEDVVK